MTAPSYRSHKAGNADKTAAVIVFSGRSKSPVAVVERSWRESRAAVFNSAPADSPRTSESTNNAIEDVPGPSNERGRSRKGGRKPVHSRVCKIQRAKRERERERERKGEERARA